MGAALAAVLGVAALGPVHAAPGESVEPVGLVGSRAAVLELRFTPTDFAQVAIWLERANGEFLTTVLLTDAVARRGVGNRPGASQMNSGFHWPYGRREGVLPVWATRRAAAPGARQFQRVIFQDRRTEGLASRTSNDFSRDDYFCLSFDRTRSSQDALDAVSCASLFSSDKGRFLTAGDVAAAYAEPYEDVATREGRMRALSLHSLYPPRRDVKACGQQSTEQACYDHEDVARYDEHTREVMPEIDMVSSATLQGGVPREVVYSVPSAWEPGAYRACLEINVEGDYNATFHPDAFPTPKTPSAMWDSWATGYGYPYRGQPSVVYCVDFRMPGSSMEYFESDTPAGSSGGWDYAAADYGTLDDASMLDDDPAKHPGSGADRLLGSANGARFVVTVKPPLSCARDVAPGSVTDLTAGTYHDALHAHQWAELQFRAAEDDRGVQRYDVRISTEPIVDEESFMRAEPARDASLEADELLVPTGMPDGSMIELELGGMVEATHYYVGVRAIDECAGAGPIEVTEITTEKRVFATVTPCFVATAAWGTPLAREIGALRRLRDRYLLTHVPGRMLVEAYYAVGPAFARVIRDQAPQTPLRRLARWLLTPLVRLADSLES